MKNTKIKNKEIMIIDIARLGLLPKNVLFYPFLIRNYPNIEDICKYLGYTPSKVYKYVTESGVYSRWFATADQAVCQYTLNGEVIQIPEKVEFG